MPDINKATVEHVITALTAILLKKGLMTETELEEAVIVAMEVKGEFE